MLYDIRRLSFDYRPQISITFGGVELHEIEALKRLEQEIRATINNALEHSKQPIYQHSSGRRLFLEEVIREGVDEGPVIGALQIVYASGQFMAVDRVERKANKFKKKRRIIYYLDSRPGQIGSTLLLELLKLSNGDKFSKHKFVQHIDKDYFQAHGINISSGEINEALSRMFRKTMPNFFGISGRDFIRTSFILRFQELHITNGRSEITYQQYKNQIDDQTNDLIRSLNKTVA